VRGNRKGDRCVYRRQFFDHNYIFRVAEACAAVLFGKDDAEQAEVAHLGDKFGGPVRGLVPFHDMRSDFRLREFANGAAQLVLFVGEGKVHVTHLLGFPYGCPKI